MAFDNLFSDDQTYSDFNLDLGTDSIWDWNFGMNSDLSSIGDTNEFFDESLNSEVDASLDSEDDKTWDMWLPDDQISSEYLADTLNNECLLEPDAASRLRKSRRSECEVEGQAKDIPPDFFGLSKDMQESLYRRLVCPSETPGESLIPVCSSRLTQNTYFDDQISNPGVWTYTLMDSFICTSVHDRVLDSIWPTSKKWLGTMWASVLHPESHFAVNPGLYTLFSNPMAPGSESWDDFRIDDCLHCWCYRMVTEPDMIVIEWQEPICFRILCRQAVTRVPSLTWLQPGLFGEKWDAQPHAVKSKGPACENYAFSFDNTFRGEWWWQIS